MKKLFGHPLKDWLLTAAVIIAVFLAVSADGFGDLANKKFWWKFWNIIWVASLLFCIGGWIYLKSKERDR